MIRSSLLLFLALSGCGASDDPCISGGFPPGGYICGAGSDDTLDEEYPSAQVVWADEAIELTVTSGSGMSLLFGVVQNDDSCVFAEEAEEGDTICWVGEACLDTAGESICHPAGSSGVRLDYTEGGIAGAQDGTADINAGDNTAFPGPGYEFKVTYYLYDQVDGDCWVWGLDTSYYTEQNFNCKEAN